MHTGRPGGLFSFRSHIMTQNRKDMTFGVIVLAIGLVYFFLTTQLPRKAGIDSATVPYFLSTLITALGVIQLVGAYTKRAAAREVQASEPAAAATQRPDYATVGVTALLIFLYVAFLDHLGFLVMSALYLFVQISVLTPVHKKKKYLLYAVISVVASAFVYYTFLWAFDIMLPSGNFWYDRGIYFEWYPF
jgi:putative tricarboxylic transport membrane protein